MRLGFLFLLITLININSIVGNDTNIPIYLINQTASQEYTKCIEAVSQQNTSACDSSQDPLTCATIVIQFATCQLTCLQKLTYSEFQSCNNECGTTATQADSSITTYINKLLSCISKLDVPPSSDTVTPPFLTDQKMIQELTSCLLSLFSGNTNPCSGSSNQAQCIIIQEQYSECSGNCAQKTSKQEFLACYQDCGKKAADADPILKKPIEDISGCIAKVTNSFILIFSIFYLLFNLLI